MSQSLKRFHVGDRLSEMAVFQNVVYLAGQVPSDATQDITGQTRQVLAMVDRLLAEAGTDNAHILMAQIYLADLADYDAMNAIWDDWCRPAMRRRVPRCRRAWLDRTGRSRSSSPRLSRRGPEPRCLSSRRLPPRPC